MRFFAIAFVLVLTGGSLVAYNMFADEINGATGHSAPQAGGRTGNHDAPPTRTAQGDQAQEIVARDSLANASENFGDLATSDLDAAPGAPETLDNLQPPADPESQPSAAATVAADGPVSDDPQPEADDETADDGASQEAASGLAGFLQSFTGSSSDKGSGGGTPRVLNGGAARGTGGAKVLTVDPG